MPAGVNETPRGLVIQKHTSSLSPLGLVEQSPDSSESHLIAE